MFNEKINGIAGAVVVTCLILGLYVQFPEIVKLIGVALGLIWGVARIVEWRVNV